MRYSRALAFLVVFNLTLSLFSMVRAQELIRINEFMAVNDNGLDDEDRDEEDWIELQCRNEHGQLRGVVSDG